MPRRFAVLTNHKSSSKTNRGRWDQYGRDTNIVSYQRIHLQRTHQLDTFVHHCKSVPSSIPCRTLLIPSDQTYSHCRKADTTRAFPSFARQQPFVPNRSGMTVSPSIIMLHHFQNPSIIVALSLNDKNTKGLLSSVLGRHDTIGQSLVAKARVP